MPEAVFRFFLDVISDRAASAIHETMAFRLPTSERCRPGQAKLSHIGQMTY